MPIRGHLDDYRRGMAPASEPAARPVWQLVLGFVGIAAHLVVGFFYLTAGLVTPLYGLIVLWIVWLALLALAIWMLRRRPVLALLVPVVALGILVGVVTLGEALLGWTA
jgi:hypothetical protein